jgi:hypothetical protein
VFTILSGPDLVWTISRIVVMRSFRTIRRRPAGDLYSCIQQLTGFSPLSQRTLEAIFGTLRCCPAYGLRAELGAAIDIALQTLARVSVERSVRGSTGGSQNIVSKSNRQRPFAVVSAWQECQPLTTAPGALSHRPGSRYTRQTGLSFTCSRCATVTTHAAGHNQRVASPVPAPRTFSPARYRVDER